MGVIQHDFVWGSQNNQSVVTAFGVAVVGCEGIDEIATRDTEKVVVAGRNGVLHLDNGRWEEREIAYKVFVPGVTSANYKDKLLAIREYFGGTYDGAYYYLADTFYPDHFNLASYAGEMEPEPLSFRTKGIILLKFACRPERFLKSGNVLDDYTAAGQIYNPTSFTAKPTIRLTVAGTGTVTFANTGGGSWALTVSNHTGGFYIDCEDWEVEDPSKLTAPDGLPVLRPGYTTFTISGGITKVEMVPRWWTL